MSDDQSARLALPYLAAGQTQKHVTLNEALTRLDALVQMTVVSRTVAVQPASPDDGHLYILPEAAEGEIWAELSAGDLVRAEPGGWSRVYPVEGLLAFVGDAGEFVVRRDGDWSPLGDTLRALGPLDRLGVGTGADAANPFAARLNKALWTAREAGDGGDGDLRLTLNKETAADILSLVFQSGWSGRAELGLVGNDDLVLKVSADGADWRTALSVDRTTGRVSFDGGAGRRETTILSSDGSWTPPVWARTVEVVAVGGGGGGGAGSFAASGDRPGGGGGGAGGVSLAVLPAAHLGGGLTVSVGAGGVAGEPGEASVVAMGGTPLVTGAGGGAGSSSGAGGRGGAGAPRSNDGGVSSLVAAGDDGGSLERADAPGGGGAGGALSAAGVPYAGGVGGAGGACAVSAAGGIGGTGGGGWGGWGAPLPDLHWSGGGGGGGGAAASGSGHAGADGGGAGAGGGGGGAGVTAGGGGGAGAAGVVWLTAQG